MKANSPIQCFLWKWLLSSYYCRRQNFHMNITQMHERLRLELLRRVQRGTLSVSLLSRQTGFGQAHLSNFLHTRRQLSLEAMDRILKAQHLTGADLLPSPDRAGFDPEGELSDRVPIVSHATALFEPLVRPSAVQAMLHVPTNLLQSTRSRVTHAQQRWQRFVAVRISAADAMAMDPVVLPDAIVVIDRHYNSLMPYRTSRPNIYAMKLESRLVLRYVESIHRRLVLRPHNIACPVNLIEVDPDQRPSDLVTGRVVLIVNET
jgi:hypothetical protein